MTLKSGMTGNKNRFMIAGQEVALIMANNATRRKTVTKRIATTE
jgi:hypothetical protein